jgi:hypothetical protein
MELQEAASRLQSNDAETRLARVLAELDRERKAVGEIQRSLLPASLPEIPGFEMSSYYRPSERRRILSGYPSPSHCWYVRKECAKPFALPPFRCKVQPVRSQRS